MLSFVACCMFFVVAIVASFLVYILNLSWLRADHLHTNMVV
jgi:hypothetical protein